MIEKNEKLILLLNENEQFTKNILVILESRYQREREKQIDPVIENGEFDKQEIISSMERLEEIKSEKARYEDDLRTFKTQLMNLQQTK